MNAYVIRNARTNKADRYVFTNRHAAELRQTYLMRTTRDLWTLEASHA